jgi:hypothetical protein
MNFVFCAVLERAQLQLCLVFILNSVVKYLYTFVVCITVTVCYVLRLLHIVVCFTVTLCYVL